MSHQTKQENQKSVVSSVNESAENDMQGGVSFAPPTLKIYVDPIDNPSPGVNGFNGGQNMATPGNPGNGAGGGGGIQTGIVQMNRGRSHRDNAYWLDYAGTIQNLIEGLLERHPERYTQIRIRIEAQGIPGMFNELSDLISQMSQLEGEVPPTITNRLMEIFSIVHNAEVPDRTPARERSNETPTDAPEARVGSFPSFFGPVSIDAMERIEAQAESWQWVSRFTVIATVVSIASANSGGTPRELAGNVAGGLTQGTYDIGNQAQALSVMPAIARRYIIDIATLTYARNGLNRREIQFWRQLIRNLGGTV